MKGWLAQDVLPEMASAGEFSTNGKETSNLAKAKDVT